MMRAVTAATQPSDGDPLSLACTLVWNNEDAFQRQKSQLIVDQVRGSRVPIRIPPAKMATASPMLKEAYRNLYATNTVCTAKSSYMCPNELLPWALFGMFFRHYFPSCLGRNFWPSAAWAGFREGYFRCAGSNRPEKAQLMFYQLMFRLMIDLRLKLRLYNFSVQNIVTATTWPCKLNLEKLALLYPVLCKFEFDMFPGGIITLDEISASFFPSGKGNLVGARTPDAPIRACEQLAPYLEQCSVYEYTVSAGEDVIKLQNILRSNSPSSNNNKTYRGVQIELDQRQHKAKKNVASKQSEKQIRAEAKALKQAMEELTRVSQKKRRSTATSYLVSLLLDMYQCSSSSNNNKNHRENDVIGAVCRKQTEAIARRLAALPRQPGNQEVSYKLVIGDQAMYASSNGILSVIDADQETQASKLVDELGRRWEISSISSMACWTQRAENPLK